MQVCAQCGRVSSEEDRFCPRCGATIEAPALERRALVSVVFADLAGSTALGERLDAEVLREVQARYFGACSAALQQHGGQVEKFIGDAVMAVFGLPRAHEDDAVRACRGALDLQAGVAALNAELERELGVQLAVRVGVHTGEVVAGDPSRGQALVTGDAVNTAARLEQAADGGEVLIGALTRDLAGGTIRVEAAAAVTAKGKAEPVPAFRLLGRARPEAPSERVRLVGRERELSRLRDGFARVTEAEACEAVHVAGEAGIGKSRLVAELLAQLPPTGHAVSGRCPAYGEAAAFWPVREMIDELTDGREEALVELVGAAPAEVLLRTIARRPGTADLDDTFDAVAALLRATAARGPLVAVFDDVHWADDTLLELMDALPGMLSGAPVLLLATARPERAVAGPDWRELRLQPLEPAAAAALLEGRGVEGERRAALVEAAGGNPMFLEQLEAAGAAPGDVPPSLRALLSARIDRLRPAQREVLDVAAVAGREFWPAGIAPLLDPDVAAALPMHLAALEAAELIGTGRAGPRQLDDLRLSGVFGSQGRSSFRHALIQQTAYDSLPRGRAAALHERFADILERQRSGAEYIALVAWHLARAADLRQALRPRAAAALEAAGRQALDRGDGAAAERLLSRAFELRPAGDPARAQLGVAIARSREVSGIRTSQVTAVPGQRLAGYDVIGIVGRGGLGVVYRAQDEGQGLIVALKVLTPQLARDTAFRERFEREARIAVRLVHPNVLPVYRAGEDAGRLFVVSRLVEGADLSALLDGPMAPADAAAILGPVADALHAAHACGLVHRRVKPTNVLLDEQREVLLADFAHPVEHDGGGPPGGPEWSGTAAYAAPEQIRGEPLDARADVYALGGVLHHCLTGRPPYPADHDLEALLAHLAEPPPRPTAVNPDVPPAFDALVARAMAKDPAERFASAAEFGGAMTEALSGGAPRAGRLRWRRRSS